MLAAGAGWKLIFFLGGGGGGGGGGGICFFFSAYMRRVAFIITSNKHPLSVFLTSFCLSK